MCLKLPDSSVMYMALPHDVDETPKQRTPKHQSHKWEMLWLLLPPAIFFLILALVGSGLAKADTLTLPAAAAIDGGPLGGLKVQGMMSGLALSQSNAMAGDENQRFDADNAQLILQKD
jgi:hypothetical protein